MKQPSESNRPSFFVIAALTLIILYGLAMRLFTAFIPLEQLIGVCLADDAFYYLQIAQNIAQGKGATFDGQIFTNGFHPLYMAICVLMKLIFPGQLTVLPVMIFFAFVGAINTLLLYLLARKIAGDAAGIAAACFWTLHPFPQFIEMMGVEAPLAVGAMLVAALWWLGIKNGRIDHKAGWVVMGVLVGLCFLARTDSIFFILILAAEMLWVYRKQWGDRFFNFLAASLAALATVAPWLIWNLVRFGRISQDSGRSLYAFSRQYNEQMGISLGDVLGRQLQVAFHDHLVRFAGFPQSKHGMIALAIAAVIGLWALFFVRDDRIGIRKGAGAFVLAGLAIWVFYNFVFWTSKYWYFLAFLAAAALVFARLVAKVAEKQPRYRWLVVALVVCILGNFWFQGASIIEWVGLHPWQRAYLQIAQSLEEGEIEGVEPGAVLGAWNAGIYGAYSNHRVVNLDGVVNPNIYDAVRKREFLKYVQEAGVEHIIDHQIMLSHFQTFSTLPFNQFLKEIHRIKVPGGGGDILILTIMKKSESEPIEKKTDETEDNPIQ